jgi:hypothetical protein
MEMCFFFLMDIFWSENKKGWEMKVFAYEALSFNTNSYY